MLNSFVGIGRVGGDATLSATRNGTPIARFSVAIKRDGKAVRNTEPYWIPCQLFGDKATKLAGYIKQGNMLGVRGKIETYKIQPEGTTKLISQFCVNVDELQFLSSGSPREHHTDFDPGEDADPAFLNC